VEKKEKKIDKKMWVDISKFFFAQRDPGCGIHDRLVGTVSICCHPLKSTPLAILFFWEALRYWLDGALRYLRAK
jgi:hypothetical protein